jgi:hypothetical protein
MAAREIETFVHRGRLRYFGGYHAASI